MGCAARIANTNFALSRPAPVQPQFLQPQVSVGPSAPPQQQQQQQQWPMLVPQPLPTMNWRQQPQQSGGGGAGVQITQRKHTPNPTLTSEATPGSLGSQTERDDCSALDSALAHRLWGLPRRNVQSTNRLGLLGANDTNGASPSAPGDVNGTAAGYDLCRMRRLQDRKPRASIDIPQTLTSINGRNTEFNTAKRDFGMNDADRKYLGQPCVKISEVARMRAQMEEQKRFNDNLLLQLNGAADSNKGNNNGNNGPVSQTIDLGNGNRVNIEIQGNKGNGQVVPDSSPSSLTRQLFEDRKQGDELRDRAVMLQVHQAKQVRDQSKARSRPSEYTSAPVAYA